jgi:hypothetical protein
MPEAAAIEAAPMKLFVIPTGVSRPVGIAVGFPTRFARQQVIPKHRETSLEMTRLLYELG